MKDQFWLYELEWKQKVSTESNEEILIDLENLDNSL